MKIKLNTCSVTPIRFVTWMVHGFGTMDIVADVGLARELFGTDRSAPSLGPTSGSDFDYSFAQWLDVALV